MAKRIGANQQKAVVAKRERRPRKIMKVGKYAGIAALVVGVGFALYTCSPAVTAKISGVFGSNGAPAAFRIVNCNSSVNAKLSGVLETLFADTCAISRADIIKAASSIPEIEKVRVNKTKTETLVKVTERKPVAIVLDGDICLVDKKGIRFAASPGQYYDLPLINVPKVSGDTLDLETFNAVRKASRNIGGGFYKQISQIDISDNEQVNLIFKSSPTEYTLAPKDIDARMTDVKTLVERLREEHREPARVDLRYKGLAVSTM